MKTSRSFKKSQGNKTSPPKAESFQIKEKLDPTIQAIEMARLHGGGVVTFHFETVESFDDYKGSVDEKTPPVKTASEKIKKWTISRSINKEVFFDDRGNSQKAEKIKLLFIQLTSDMGAKYFTI